MRWEGSEIRARGFGEKRVKGGREIFGKLQVGKNVDSTRRAGGTRGATGGGAAGGGASEARRRAAAAGRVDAAQCNTG